MKMKKLMALLLTAALAIGLLAGCSSSSSSGSLNLTEVNSALESVGSKCTVQSSSPLNNAVRNATDEMVESGSFSTWTANTKIAAKMGWPKISLTSLEVRAGAAVVVSDELLERGISFSSVAGMVGISSDKLGELGTINTPEKFAAAVVLAADEAAGKYVTASNIAKMKYSASARKGKASDGTYYWVIAAEATAQLLA